MQQFFALINAVLAESAAARARRLRIATYKARPCRGCSKRTLTLTLLKQSQHALSHIEGGSICQPAAEAPSGMASGVRGACRSLQAWQSPRAAAPPSHGLAGLPAPSSVRRKTLCGENTRVNPAGGALLAGGGPAGVGGGHDAAVRLPDRPHAHDRRARALPAARRYHLPGRVPHDGAAPGRRAATRPRRAAPRLHRRGARLRAPPAAPVPARRAARRRAPMT